MLKRQYGRIINIASIAGMHASVHGPHYAATREQGGLIGLTRELAASWARRASASTRSRRASFTRASPIRRDCACRADRSRRRSPIPRVGDAGELKGVAVFLAADASNYITGQTIVVDGGRTIACVSSPSPYRAPVAAALRLLGAAAHVVSRAAADDILA
jgi:NAD(P)-dependent dehydrogenase (short-subunit alcohol dehydrogenase family)